MDREFINNPVEAYTRLNSLYNDNCEYTKKLEDTLQEIKEMILCCDDEYDCDKCRYHDKCQPNEGEFPDFSKALLQKIAESEEE